MSSIAHIEGIKNRTEHLLLAADLIDRAIEEVEAAGYSITIEKLRDVYLHLLKLISYLDTGGAP